MHPSSLTTTNAESQSEKTAARKGDDDPSSSMMQPPKKKAKRNNSDDNDNDQQPIVGFLSSLGRFLSGTWFWPSSMPIDDDNSNGDKKMEDLNTESHRMDPIVAAACELAILSAFGGSSSTSKASYRPIGSAADTAFSGSVVLELEVTEVVPVSVSKDDNNNNDDETVSSTSSQVVDRVVLKHSSVRTLSSLFETEKEENRDMKNSKKYAAAVKVDRSSRNECTFLQTYWERILMNNHNKTRIPGVLFARDHSTEGVTLLLESLSSFGIDDSNGNGNSDNINNRINEIPLGPKTNATLEWLANFHAAFLPKSLNPNAFDFPTAGNTLDEPSSPFMWSVGTHLSLEKRSPTELQDLPKDLSDFVERFQDRHDYFRTSQAAKGQGRRIQAVAADIAATLHPDNNPSRKTIVHGDYKQGNMFFANDDGACDDENCSNDSDNNNEDCQIAVFDWQWTGPGIGATDLVYLCVMAVSDEALEDYEKHILKPYHNYLMQALKRGNNGKDDDDNDDGNDDDKYPYSELCNEFKIAAIDIQRWLGGSRLKSMTPETVFKANQNIDVNHGIFRRSTERLIWIFQTVDKALDDVESGRIQLVSAASKKSKV